MKVSHSPRKGKGGSALDSRVQAWLKLLDAFDDLKDVVRESRDVLPNYGQILELICESQDFVLTARPRRARK